MTFEELRQKARSLPLEPGVYLMHDAAGEVIYVGKAKKLRNRVSQYFQDTASHTPKTRMMVSRIADFDVIVAASEFEALVLECSLIKRHQPKYNILLKDDKGYPFVRIDLREPYPSMRMENRALEDGASYFGPFGARNTTQYLLDTLRLTYKLPGCGKKLPRDIGKERPCLNFQMGNCSGWCRPECTQAQYAGVMDQALRVLRGDNRELVRLSRTAALGCLVAGNLTTMRGSTDDPEAMRNAYRCQMKALIAGDVDLIAAETLMDADETKIILELAEELSAPAVMISFTCRGDRLFSGEDLTETLRAAEEAGAAAVGINCVPASAELPELIGRLRGMTGLPLVCKPNAGYPVQGQYPIGIQEYTSLLLGCAGKGANLIGGCCGTTPDYIRNLRRCMRQEEHPD